MNALSYFFSAKLKNLLLSGKMYLAEGLHSYLSGLHFAVAARHCPSRHDGKMKRARNPGLTRNPRSGRIKCNLKSARIFAINGYVSQGCISNCRTA
jgi:hypothetical protein